MKKFAFIFLIMVAMILSVSAAVKNYGVVAVFADTVISTGDSIKTISLVPYYGLQSTYSTKYNGNPLFVGKTLFVVAYIDTLVDNDSCDVDLEIAVKNSTVGVWSDYVSLATLDVDSLNKVKIYAIDAWTQKGLMFADSFRLKVDGDTDNDKSAGVLVKAWLGYGQDGY